MRDIYYYLPNQSRSSLTSELLRSTLTWCHSLSSKRTPFFFRPSAAEAAESADAGAAGRMEVSKGEPEPSCTASDTRPSFSDSRR